MIIPPFQASNFAKLQDRRFNSEYQMSYSGKQLILVIGGGIFWFLVIIGLVFGDPNKTI